eukprot:COSAG01_NODE_1508_length_10054_cov_3.434713_8_plen_83_part_00
MAVPACSRCGGARQFEFQVQPQLLHYLTSNAPEGSVVRQTYGFSRLHLCPKSPFRSAAARSFAWLPVCLSVPLVDLLCRGCW